jgi:hypothetical protein
MCPDWLGQDREILNPFGKNRLGAKLAHVENTAKSSGAIPAGIRLRKSNRRSLRRTVSAFIAGRVAPGLTAHLPLCGPKAVDCSVDR